jgi:hypothetical protein
MTFADGVLRLVRIGARIDSVDDDDPGLAPQGADQVGGKTALAPAAEAPASPMVGPTAAGEVPGLAGWGPAQPDSVEAQEARPGLDDLEAAVALVQAGLASRVILTGFPSWPGLLWRAYQLAGETGVQILPTVVRPGGHVDIVISRDHGVDG